MISKGLAHAIVGVVLIGTATGSRIHPPVAADHVISPASEHALALKLRDSFLLENPPIDDAGLSETVKRVGRRLAGFSDRPDLPYGFFVVESGDASADLQAFSLPGGTVALTRALAELLAASEDEMAFAVAHEIAHVALRHHLSPSEIFDANGRAADRFVTTARRHHELEADRYGALYAIRAGFRFTAANDAIRRLALARSGVAEKTDHPSYETRIAALQAFRPILERSVDAFDAGLAALQSGDAAEAIAATSLFVQQFPQSVAGRVNLGTACLVRLAIAGGSPGGLEEPMPLFEAPEIRLRGVYDGELLARARRSFLQALAVRPSSREALLGMSLVALREGDTELADEMLSRADDTSESDADFLVVRGNARYLAGEPERAAELYRRALRLRREWPIAKKNLALAYEAAGQWKNAESPSNLTRDLIAEDRPSRQGGPKAPSRDSDNERYGEPRRGGPPRRQVEGQRQVE